MSNLHDLASKNPSPEAQAAIKKALKGAADDQKQVHKQAKLIEFLNDPETLKVAAEGSMQKRQEVLDRSSSDLPRKIRQLVFAHYPHDDKYRQVEAIEALVASEQSRILDAISYHFAIPVKDLEGVL